MYFINRRSRPQITTGYTLDKCSAYLSAVAARCVDNSGSLFMHTACAALSQVKTPLWGHSGNGIPSISPICAQARRTFTQVIHTVVHSNIDKQFSLPVKSVPLRKARKSTARMEMSPGEGVHGEDGAESATSCTGCWTTSSMATSGRCRAWMTAWRSDEGGPTGLPPLPGVPAGHGKARQPPR